MKLLKTKNIAISELILDYTIYPRHVIDNVQVANYVQSHRAGATFPLMRIDDKTKRVVDGFHRFRMYQIIKKDTVEVELYKFNNEADIFWWAVKWNADHGLRLSNYDRTRIIIVGKKFGLSEKRITAAINITLPALKKILIKRTRLVRIESVNKGRGKHKPLFERVPVKRMVSDATKEDEVINDGLVKEQKSIPGGGRPIYYVGLVETILRRNLLEGKAEYRQHVESLLDACEKWLKENKERVAA